MSSNAKPRVGSVVTIERDDFLSGKYARKIRRHLVQVRHRMTNRKGATMCTGTAELQLPKKPD